MEPAPDPEKVAADILSGEPKPGSSTERTRRFRERQRAAEAETAAAPPAPAVAMPNAKETGVMIGELWDAAFVPIAGRWKDGTPRLKSLTPAQADRMGEAYAPLVAKYLPLIASWQVEISALIVTVAVVRAAANPRPVEVWSNAPLSTDAQAPAGA